jgi:hypothetical protein
MLRNADQICAERTEVCLLVYAPLMDLSRFLSGNSVAGLLSPDARNPRKSFFTV